MNTTVGDFWWVVPLINPTFAFIRAIWKPSFFHSKTANHVFRVNNLRKSGNLQDAFAMAQADMNADPGNIWNKRSMGWVYFDQLKAASQVEQFEAFEQILCSIAELGLPVEEDMFWEQICWQIGKMAFLPFRRPNPPTSPNWIICSSALSPCLSK
ncbi:MAG: hypothetical protein R2791_12355 [Saprospiraceae bacterium]